MDIIIDVSAYTEEQVDILHKIMKNRFKQYILISSASVYNNRIYKWRKSGRREFNLEMIVKINI